MAYFIIISIFLSINFSHHHIFNLRIILLKKKKFAINMSTENTRMSNNGHSHPSGPIAEDPNSSSDVKPVSIFSTDYKKFEYCFFC